MLKITTLCFYIRMQLVVCESLGQICGLFYQARFSLVVFCALDFKSFGIFIFAIGL